MKNCLVLAAFCLSNTATGQRLPELILLAQENNPELQAYELRYSLAREKLAEANQYPDTEVSAGLFVSEPETRTGAQKARFSIRQMLPWFGVITARENYASAMADAEYESLSMARRQLVMDVALAYYGLVTNHESARVINENISLINNYEQQALIAVEVGKASVVDVLRLRIRLNELQERIAILKEEFISMETAMNALLNRALNTPVMVSDSLVIPAEDPAPDLSSIAAHPELLKYDRLFESVAMAEFINQKESAPNLGFGLDYVPVQERPDMAFSDNGKDILMPMVSLSIPIFNNSYEAQSRQNTLRQQELTALRKDRENMLRSRLQTAITSRNTARIRFQTQADNLEQAKNAEQILLRNYETGRVDYKEVLDIMDMVIKIRLARIEAAHNYFIQSAVINYLAEPMQ